MLKYSDLNSNDGISRWIENTIPYLRIVGLEHYEEPLDKYSGKIVVNMKDPSYQMKIIFNSSINKIDIRQNIIPVKFNKTVKVVEDYSLPGEINIVKGMQQPIKTWVIHNQDTFISHTSRSIYFGSLHEAKSVKIRFNDSNKGKFGLKFIQILNEFECDSVILFVPIKVLGEFKIAGLPMTHRSLGIGSSDSIVKKLVINSNGIVVTELLGDSDRREKIPFEKLERSSKTELFKLLRKFIKSTKIHTSTEIRMNFIDEDDYTYIDED